MRAGVVFFLFRGIFVFGTIFRFESGTKKILEAYVRPSAALLSSQVSLSLSLQVALRITVLNYVIEKRSNLRLVDRYGSVWAWLPFSSLKLSRDNTDCRLLLSPTSC